MLFGGDAPMAYGLTRGMARAVGVDLIEAASAGRIAHRDLEALIDTCAACPHTTRCTQFLAVTVEAARPPEYCGIRSRLEALQGR